MNLAVIGILVFGGIVAAILVVRNQNGERSRQARGGSSGNAYLYSDGSSRDDADTPSDSGGDGGGGGDGGD
jgi:hypothetical protein